MTEDQTNSAVEKLIEKAAEAQDSGDAMRFSQAACNAANARAVVTTTKRQGG